MSYDNLDRPQPFSEEDITLAREFYQAKALIKRLSVLLDTSLKTLFSFCEWRITQGENNLTELVVCCPSSVVYKRLYNRAFSLHSRLENSVFFKPTKLIIYYPKDPKAYYECERSYSEEN